MDNKNTLVYKIAKYLWDVNNDHCMGMNFEQAIANEIGVGEYFDDAKGVLRITRDELAELQCEYNKLQCKYLNLVDVYDTAIGEIARLKQKEQVVCKKELATTEKIIQKLEKVLPPR